MGAVGSALAHQAPSPGAEPRRQSQVLGAGSFGSPTASDGPGLGAVEGIQPRAQGVRTGEKAPTYA